MRKNSKEFEQIKILKERQKLRILEQEIKIKSNLKEFAENLATEALLKRFKSKFSGSSALAMKLGFMAASLFSGRLKHKRKK